MATKKYVSDYRPVFETDANGRVRQRYEYIGPYFGYRLGGEALRREKKRCAALALCCVPLLIVPLSVTGPIIRRGGVMAPLAFGVLPVAKLLFCTLRALGGKDRFTRREKDAVAGQLAPWSFALLFLCALSLVFQVRFWLSGEGTAADLAVSLSTLGLCVPAALLFSRRRSLEMEEERADNADSYGENRVD